MIAREKAVKPGLQNMLIITDKFPHHQKIKYNKNKVVKIMPTIRPISDLRNNSNEISEFCRSSREPVFITKNGVGDMVVLSIDMYERQQAQLELYAKLAEAEAEAISESTGVSYYEFVKKQRVEENG